LEEDPIEISKKLMQTEFEKVIQILPKVYLKDGHMMPQYLARKIVFSKFGVHMSIPIRFEKFFKIESKEDLEELSKIFELDLSRKLNNTKVFNTNINWSKQSIEIVKGLYEKDFKYFNYENDLRFENDKK
jgi:hypothetical protein